MQIKDEELKGKENEKQQNKRYAVPISFLNEVCPNKVVTIILLYTLTTEPIRLLKSAISFDNNNSIDNDLQFTIHNYIYT